MNEMNAKMLVIYLVVLCSGVSFIEKSYFIIENQQKRNIKEFSKIFMLKHK